MQSKIKRLLSMLMVFVLILGLIPSAAAATDDGTKDVTDPTATVEATPTETTAPTESSEQSIPSTPTEPPEDTEPDPDEEWDPLEPTPEDLERWAELASQLPNTIEEEWPFDPDVKYPYGEPQENYYPGILLEPDPYGISLLADMSLIPDEMYDNAILRALEYTGYDVQWLKDNSYLYVAQYVSSNINNTRPAVLSDIGYDDYSPFLNGDETVADASTVTGLAPDIASFESSGLVCASFVTYFLCNYLPNIEGVDTTWIHDAVKATTATSTGYSTASVWAWETGLTNLANTPGSGVTKYTDETTAYANLVPGDVIIFSRDGSLVHAAIYAGSYDMYNVSGTNRGEQHFIIHVGNSRGPEISTTGYMANGGSKASTPSAWYHIEYPEAVEATGFIEVYKKDPAGAALSGARFRAVNQDTGDTFYIGPTNSSGYAISGELLLGCYVVTETTFPSGYEASGQSSWTVTLTEDTPNMTITINAVNQKITGSLKIQKATNTGANLSGWSFGVYTDSACTKPISGSPFTTNSSGVITVTGLEPKTYYVKELSGSTDYWVTDNGVKTVTVSSGSTATVTVTNTHYGYGKIVKTTNTGGSLSGWKFNIYTNSACTQLVSGSPFTSGTDGTIAVKLLPGTYYCREVDESDQYPDWTFDTATRTLTVTAGSTATVTFSNSQSGSAQIIKKTNTGGSLAGWKFNIYTDSACTKLVSGSPFTSDSTGIITVNLSPADYWVREVDESSKYPDWTFDTTTRKVTVKAGQTASVTFTNNQYGYGKIVKKTNTGENLAGWKFNIYTNEACTNLVAGSPFTTDSDGTITVMLMPNKYYIREIDESDSKPEWSFDTVTRVVTVTAGNTASVTFTNYRSGYAKIVKETSTGEDLGGWKFNIYQDEGCTTLEEGSPFISGDDGTISAMLRPGDYWIQEIDESSSHPDWTYDTTVRKVSVKAGETASVVFTNTHYGYAKLVKTTNTGKDLSGWKFDIYTDAACTKLLSGSPFVSGEDGNITARILPGNYFVVERDESATKPGWVFDDKVHIITVMAGETAVVTIENTQLGQVKIIKAMPDGGSIAGWEFDIHRVSDNSLVGTFVSGEDGSILSGYLEAGDYRVTEKLPENSEYACEEENPKTITVVPGEVASVTFTNRLKPGKIAILKVDMTGAPLAGAEFLLEWSEDGTIWTPVQSSASGQIIKGGCTSADLQNGKLISGTDGVVSFEGLHPKLQYRLTESKAPAGYQLLAGPAYEGLLPADTEFLVELSVVNAHEFVLPQTGSRSMALMLVALCLACSLCGGILLYLKRKSSKEE